MMTWARTLQKPRTDIQVALEVIGRRKPHQIKIERDATVRGSKVGYRLDLRSTCLQRADLSELNFINGFFQAAQLQGAILSGAQFQETILFGAQLHGARLFKAQLQRASLGRSQLQGAHIVEADLANAKLFWAQLHGANLERAQLQGANLVEAHLHGAELSWAQLHGANLNGAAVRDVNFRNTTIKQDQIIAMFGDATVTLPGGHGPDHENWPKHWSKSKLSWDEFETEWRAFQLSIGQDPDNPT